MGKVSGRTSGELGATACDCDSLIYFGFRAEYGLEAILNHLILILQTHLLFKTLSNSY